MKQYLQQLGVYGYDSVEPVILAALVTEDPLLLIGKAGTGKTFLLNSLSEALGLEHRHYNASLIAFDDLVGFPWPAPDGTSIRYIETPATVWQANSVLVDELNRCKPEHQNRLFSLVHERRVQGIKLPRLRYRWAAINPVGLDQDGETYAGCEPLDAALADRFAFLVEVSDWLQLTAADQHAIAQPGGDGAISRDTLGLTSFITEARARFTDVIARGDPLATNYACQASTALNEAGLRISPRRVRQLARNLIAIGCVSSLPRERLYRLALTWSLPQRSGLLRIDDAVVQAAHVTAWEATCSEGDERWLYEFHREPDLRRKLERLLTSCPSPDVGTIALSQFIATEPQQHIALFAFVLYPLLLQHPKPPVGAEGIQDLGVIANAILSVDGKVQFRDSDKKPFRLPKDIPYEETLPRFKPTEDYLNTLSGRRKLRAAQLFYHLLSRGWTTDQPADVEKQLEACIRTVRKHHGPTPQ